MKTDHHTPMKTTTVICITIIICSLIISFFNIYSIQSTKGGAYKLNKLTGNVWLIKNKKIYKIAPAPTSENSSDETQNGSPFINNLKTIYGMQGRK